MVDDALGAGDVQPVVAMGGRRLRAQ